MKTWVGILLLLPVSLQLPAQTSPPARLAMRAESDEAGAVVDVMTAKLAATGNVQLLEREEIERVFREQATSQANRNDLKLGRLLGADGLLIFGVARTPQATNLTARLIAVKPGLVLADERIVWPLPNLDEWSTTFARHLELLIPKLTVSAGDAIPVSVVNFRSATRSAEAEETERELKLLAIERLSRERRLFVLERQRMRWLGGEKELNADESAFWDGSYLLEGVVDQNGYTKDTVTLNARLTPSKGGKPLLFEVSGARADLTEVINRLADKVNGLLRVSSSVPEWKAADEAAQYFEEAQWALRWGMVPEARAAADSAWALGKRDMDCATTRIKAYENRSRLGIEGSMVDKGIAYRTDESSRSWTIREIKKETAGRPGALYVLREQGIDGTIITAAPDPESIEDAIHVMVSYLDFSRTLQPEGIKPDSAWCRLGIEELAAASQVLLQYYLVPGARISSADKLAELRGTIRSTAAWISSLPSVQASYFVGDRTVTSDELYHSIRENPNIFSCQAEWGGLWQETPEDGIGLYRNLMASPVFSYIHDKVWLRRVERPTGGDMFVNQFEAPRLAAWNEQDRSRIPAVWSDFIQSLKNSTNRFWQLEAEAFQVADGDGETGLDITTDIIPQIDRYLKNADKSKWAASFTNFLEAMLENREFLVTNNVEVMYLNWGVDELVSSRITYGADTDTRTMMRRLYDSEYRTKLEAMDKEYWSKTISAREQLSKFEKQKQYLRENRPYNFSEFATLFFPRDFTKAQVLEIQPLLAAYKSNLLARPEPTNNIQKLRLKGQSNELTFLERDLNRILNPPPPQPRPPQPTLQKPPPLVAASAPPVLPVRPAPAESATNLVTVSRFLAVPLEGLPGDTNYNACIVAHHWIEGKLLLDLRYSAELYEFDANGKWKASRNPTLYAIAILDPTTEQWEVIACPEPTSGALENRFYHHTTLLNGALFTCEGGQIRKYDFNSRQWQVLEISDGGMYQLLALNGRLYAADQNMIFEILDDGKATRILASNRRRPPASVLDTETLGIRMVTGGAWAPTLLAGPGQSLRAGTLKGIYTWNGGDWRQDSPAPPSTLTAEIFPEGVLFRNEPGGMAQPAELSFLATDGTAAELWLREKPRTPTQSGPPGANRPRADTQPAPLCKLPAGLSLASLPAAMHGRDLFLLADHSEGREIVNDEHVLAKFEILPKDGYHASLLAFCRDVPEPQSLRLKFDAPDGCPPVAGIDPGNPVWMPTMPPAWMLCTSNLLICGLERPNGSMPNNTDRLGTGYKTGVWLLPLSQIEPPIAAQRQLQMAGRLQAAAAVEQARKDLLAKYDRNHNGVIDPDERGAGLEDPVFIESQLDVIDANHNGLLDVWELAWFDANTNKALEPREQAGIDLAQHLLAAKLLRQFDANGDGFLDRSEFNDLVMNGLGAEARPLSQPFVSFPDGNHDGRVDVDELEWFLKQQTHRELRERVSPHMAAIRQSMTNPNGGLDPQQLFKAELEYYWLNPGLTNRPPRRIGPPGSPPTNGPTNRTAQ